MNGDARTDIVGISSIGRMYFYAGRGNGTFDIAVQTGQGWLNAVFSSGADLNGDGLRDMLGRDSAGVLTFYSGISGGSFAAGVQVGTGW